MHKGSHMKKRSFKCFLLGIVFKVHDEYSKCVIVSLQNVPYQGCTKILFHPKYLLRPAGSGTFDRAHFIFLLMDGTWERFLHSLTLIHIFITSS